MPEFLIGMFLGIITLNPKLRRIFLTIIWWILRHLVKEAKDYTMIYQEPDPPQYRFSSLKQPNTSYQWHDNPPVVHPTTPQEPMPLKSNARAFISQKEAMELIKERSEPYNRFMAEHRQHKELPKPETPKTHEPKVNAVSPDVERDGNGNLVMSEATFKKLTANNPDLKVEDRS